MREEANVQVDEELREIDREYLDAIAEALRRGRTRSRRDDGPLNRPNPGDELVLTGARLGWL